MTMSERADFDPLDRMLTRGDVLELLHELAHARDSARDQSGAIAPGQSSLAVHANALEQKFRAQWSKVPKPEKLEGDVTCEPHDG